MSEAIPTHQVSSPNAAVFRAIDHSGRWPILLCFASAAFWLIVGSLLESAAAIKLVVPGFLDFAGILTYGRVHPAALNFLVYGWASLAGIGIALWMMARLCEAPLRYLAVLVCGIVLWNIAILVGGLSILGGAGSSVEWLEMPAAVAAILFFAYVVIAVWALVLFGSRSREDGFVSQWYLLAALFSFPWLYATANVLLRWNPIQGSAVPPIQGWYGAGLGVLWLTPLAIAVIYYFVSDAVKRPVFSGSLAMLGFWTLLLFGAWSGMRYLIGGPVPAWMMSASVAAAVLLMVPMGAVWTNLAKTIGSDYPAINHLTAVRFGVAGFIFYGLLTVVNALASFPSVSSVFQFTMLAAGQTQALIWGFVSMVFFGAIYTIGPKLIGRDWARASLIGVHFWFLVTGAGLLIVAALVGALVQGFALADPAITFINTVQFAVPFRVLTAVGELVILAGNGIFGLILAATFLREASMLPSAPASESLVSAQEVSV